MKLYPSQPEDETIIRLMWRVRPFSGGPWVVFPTTKAVFEHLTFEAKAGSSYEVQLVEMTPEEFASLPEDDS